MSRENVELVRLAYEQGYARREVDSIRDRLAADFRFYTRPEFPGEKLSYTADEVARLWADLDETYTEYSLVPEDFTELGEYVLVTLTQSAQLRDSGSRIEAKTYHLWKVEDGKVLAGWAYASREVALDAVGLEE